MRWSGRKRRVLPTNTYKALAQSAEAFGRVDVICGGFPCQDISAAKQNPEGIDGKQSGLFVEIVRVASITRPKWVILENVPTITVRGLGRVLFEFSKIGYDAEWTCISAAQIGANHKRDRWWLVAYPRCKHGEQGAKIVPRLHRLVKEWHSRGESERPNQMGEIADTKSKGLEGGNGARVASGIFTGPAWWLSEPDICRVDDGVPFRSHRLRSLGNALLPQIPYLIGKAILEVEASL